ncbi:hypothetical protein Len3610_12085 [Lentibacillus sp. CBA3610]|nr:hypothetical protein Len3610_12085 [Lentibacillus sp. CBA3610]
MPALGISSSAFVNHGWPGSYNDFSERFLVTAETKTYEPDMVNHGVYEGAYQKYLKLYPNLKEIYD